MSNAMCWLPTWLCVYYPLECQVLHEFDLSHYVMTSFFVQEAMGKEAGIDEFSETATICLNKALFSIPRTLARRPSSQPVPPEQAFLWCLHVSTLDPGKLGSSLTLGASSLELICPQVNSKGRSHMKALSLNGVGKVEIAQSFLFLHLPVEHWPFGGGDTGDSVIGAIGLELLQTPRKSVGC